MWVSHHLVSNELATFQHEPTASHHACATTNHQPTRPPSPHRQATRCSYFTRTCPNHATATSPRPASAYGETGYYTTSPTHTAYNTPGSSLPEPSPYR
ncbi:hypothetical protein M8J77_013299 [Diaphorina citri]|nr:hypothetical protein M8J77_013299 [Diaphorina citri]